MAGAVYVLDANVFIEAARRYYAFDLVPAFWVGLEKYAQSGQILSIDRVKAELANGKDELATWTKHTWNNAFQPTDEPAVIRAFGHIMNWVQTQPYTDAAKAELADCADGWLVAYAMVHATVVVTHEVFSVDKKNRVKIPNLCKQFNVRYINTFEMLRELGTRLNF